VPAPAPAAPAAAAARPAPPRPPRSRRGLIMFAVGFLCGMAALFGIALLAALKGL
jgi:hypothetical protein